MKAEKETAMKNIGLAIDYGTSRIRAALADLGSGRVISAVDCPNRLRQYGRDILTRTACCAEGDSKKEEVFNCAGEALGDVLNALAVKSGTDVFEAEKIVIAANTTHMYFLLRRDPSCICAPPYEIPLHAPGWLEGKTLYPGLSGRCRAFLVPCRANYLGGDMLCALLGLGPDQMKDGSAFFDMGENGELVIRSGNTLYCGSCAAGCALSSDGIKGSRMTSILADLYRSGLVNRRGRLQAEGHLEVRQILEAGKTRPSLTVSLADGHILRQADISGYMQAKASVATMIDYMTEAAGLEKTGLKVFYLTGSLGQNLDSEEASVTGLIPLPDLSIVKTVPGAVLTGAVMLLTDRQKFREMETLYEMLHYVQLREIDDYLELMLPNLTLPGR